MPDSRIFLANERMDITEAARFIGMDILGDFQLAKHYCPFGVVFHMDGGASRAFKFYTDSNTAYCFAGCGHFTPTKLVAMDRNLSQPEAAEVILQETGYVEPTVEAQWTAATTVAEKIDRDYLSEALKVYCSRIDPNWTTTQYEDRVADMLQRCLELTSAVTSTAQADEWLTKTKTVMRRTLTGDNS